MCSGLRLKSSHVNEFEDWNKRAFLTSLKSQFVTSRMYSQKVDSFDLNASSTQTKSTTILKSISQDTFRFSHLDSNGNARMVDISDKQLTRRQATATGFISLSPDTLTQLSSGTNKKGDILTVSKIAGIQAVKQTAHMIPLCHPLLYSMINLEFEIDDHEKGVHVYCTVKVNEGTGCEVEALLGVVVSLTCIYDMCKAVDRNMVISKVMLLSKSGGRSGDYVRLNNTDWFDDIIPLNYLHYVIVLL